MKKKKFIWLMPGIISFALVCGLKSLSLFAPLDIWSLSKRFELREMINRAVVPTDEIVVVGIDETTFRALKKSWPFPRNIIASAIDKLKDAKASVIGIDIAMDMEDLFDPENDKILAASIKRANNVILTSVVRENKDSIEYPIPLLREASYGVGIVNIPVLRRDGGLIMRAWAFKKSNGLILPSFAAAILVKHLNPESTSLENSFINFDGFNLLIPKYSIPVSKEGMFRINFPNQGYRIIPFFEILKMDKDELRNLCKDKIILMGGAFSEADSFTIPMFQKKADGRRNNTLFGVEYWANVISTMITGTYLSETGAISNTIIIFLICLLTSFLYFRAKVLWGIVFLFFLSILYLIVALYILGRYYLIVPTFYPVLGIILSFIGCIIHSYKTTFSELISRTSLRNVQESYQEITILCSDIRDFSSISLHYKDNPKELFDLINLYFGLMNSIVKKYSGEINKYIGDGMMVIYLPDKKKEHHALRAVYTAIEMVKTIMNEKMLQEIKNITGRDFKIGVGIYTGYAFLGDIGSKERREFTAIGYTVNQAFWIEGLNKEFNTNILINKSTYIIVKDLINCKYRGMYYDKVKKEEIDIYEALLDQVE